MATAARAHDCLVNVHFGDTERSPLQHEVL
jgi:hypothetical protein